MNSFIGAISRLRYRVAAAPTQRRNTEATKPHRYRSRELINNAFGALSALSTSFTQYDVERDRIVVKL